MSNDYFTGWTSLPRFGLARAEAVNAIFQAVEAGFDLLPSTSKTNSGSIMFAKDTSVSANTFTVAMTTAVTSYTDGLSLSILAANSVTGAATVNIDAVGATAIKRFDGSDLLSDDIVLGQVFDITHDLTNSYFVLTSQHGASITEGAANVGYAEEWANKAEDSPVSVAAGGDGSTEFSALHHAFKAAASASSASTSASTATTQAGIATTKASEASASATLAAAAAASNLFSKLKEKSSADSPYAVIADTDDGTLFACDSSTGNLTYTMPSIALALEGERYGFLRVGATNVVDFDRFGTDTINGVAGTYTMNAIDGEFLVFVADENSPNNWLVIPWSQVAADEDTLTKVGGSMSIKNGGVGIPQAASSIKVYDLAFNAGFDATNTPEDLAVQTYAEMVEGRSGSYTGETGYIDTVATGAAVILDIEKNGTSIYTVKPQFAVSTSTLTAGTLKTDGTEDYVAGDRTTFKATQIGSTIAGQGVRFTALREVT